MAAACPPPAAAAEPAYRGGDDEIVAARPAPAQRRPTVASPDAVVNPSQRRSASTGVALASFGAKALGGLKDSVTKPEELGKLVGGGVAFEVLKNIYEHLAAPLLASHGMARQRTPHDAAGASETAAS